MKENATFKRIPGGIFGILGPSFVFLGSFISSFGIRNYSMLNYFVSELGNDTNPFAMIFNVCLTIGALCNFLSVTNLEGFTPTGYNWIGVRIAMFSSICVALVGIFPMTNIVPHLVFALSFFITGFFAMAFITMGIWRDKSNSISKWFSIPSLIVIVSFALFLFYPSETFTEAHAGDMSVFAMSAEFRPAFRSVTFFEWMILLTLNGWIFFMGIYKVRTNRKKELNSHIINKTIENQSISTITNEN